MFRFLSALAVASVLAMASPSRAAPSVEDYGKLPAMEMVTLSPSGERYAFVADDKGVRRLYIATSRNQPIEIVKIGAVKVWDVQWAGDDFVLVRISTTVFRGLDNYIVPKQELSTVVVINLRKHTQMAAFEHGAHRVASPVYGVYGTAEFDGRWYGYFGGLSLEMNQAGEDHYSNVSFDGNTRTTNADLFRVDLDTGAIERAARGEENSAGWLVGPTGQIIARSLYNEKTGEWQLLTGAFDGRQLASGHQKLGGVDLLGLSRTTDSILIARDTDDDVITEELPLSGGPAKTVSQGMTAESPIMDVRSGLWIGATAYDDEPVSTMFSPQNNLKVRGARKAFPGYRAALTSWSADFNRMIMFTDGGDDSGTYWIVDIAKKTADPLGEAYPTVRSADVGLTRMVDWKAADGLALRGVLTLPPGREPKNLPLVVMPHGGPEDRDYPGFDYWAQAFTSRGYAVFQPNFRGSTGYGLKLTQAGYGEWGRKMQTDISDGAAELARQGIVNPKRACIVGGSYGGYAALAGVTVQHGLYRCSVSVAGVADLSRFFFYTRDEGGGHESSTTRFWKTFVGATSNGAGMTAISPANLADRADAPILLIHGKDDTTVPIDQSDAMERALKAAGKPVERLTLDHADHHFLEQDARMAMIEASVAFVEKYNPADPASQTVVAGSGAAH
jgi:dipeptidyl aminopeptidase/acylaminoacyl peptidase